MIDILERVEEMCGAAAFGRLMELGALADGYGAGLYLVGGAVRDMFLGRAGVPDLDLVVEGDAPAFAFAAAGKFGGKCTVHKSFGTASVELPGEPPLRFDFATARTETYRKPGVLPAVSPAKSIHEDLSRRDFSYNAMAVKICGGGSGEVVDPHGGMDDLEAGLTRILHEASFEDDPTRVLRGVRFNARFGFAFEHATGSLASRAVDEHRLGGVSGARVRKEIRASLEEVRRADIIDVLGAMDVFETLVPGLRLHTRLMSPDDLVADGIAVVRSGPDAQEVQEWVAYLLAALEGSDRDGLHQAAVRLALSKREAAPLLDNLSGSDRERAAVADPHSEACEVEELLAAAEPETLAVMYAAAGPGLVRDRIEAFVKSPCGVRLEISGKDLLSMGHEPSAVFGEVLREVRRAKIEGKVNNRRQEIALARKLMDKWA